MAEPPTAATTSTPIPTAKAPTVGIPSTPFPVAQAEASAKPSHLSPMAEAEAGRKRQWQDDFDPNLRNLLRHYMVTEFARMFNADERPIPEAAYALVANHENHAFSTAQTKEYYMGLISLRLKTVEQKLLELQVATVGNSLNQPMQMAYQMPFGNPVQAFPLVASGGIQSGQQIDLSILMQCQNRGQAPQLQQTTLACYNPANVAQTQGKLPVLPPNAQPNQKVCEQEVLNQQGNLHLPSQKTTETVNHNEAVDRREDVIQKMNAWKATYFPELMEQSTETANDNETVDWREDMFQKIESLKAAYLPELMVLDRRVSIPKRAEEEVQSWPQKIADTYRRKVHFKDTITDVLKFLQLQKTEIPETYREKLAEYETTIHKLLDMHKLIKASIKDSTIGKKSQDLLRNPQTIDLTDITRPINGRKSGQKNQSEQPPDASISETRQNVVLASSPAAFHSSANSMKVALPAMNLVPPPPSDGSDNNWKRSNNSTTTYLGEHDAKRQKTQDAREVLLDEINGINSHLIDTAISIPDRDNPTDGVTSCNGGILIKLLYTGVSLAPHIRVMPVTLLVPGDYPGSSPTIICVKGNNEQLRNHPSSISAKAHATFAQALGGLAEPRSLKDTACAWDDCVRQAVTGVMQQFAGGALGSRLGGCETTVGV